MKRNDIDLIPFYSRVYRYESKQDYSSRMFNEIYNNLQTYTYSTPRYEPLDMAWTVTYNGRLTNTVSSNEVTSTTLSTPTAQLYYMDYIMPALNAMPSSTTISTEII